MQSRYKDGQADFESYVSNPLAATLKNEYPALVTNYYRWLWKNAALSNGDKYFWDNIQMGDTTFLSIFGFQLLYGNKGTAFKEPNSVVLTEEKALKFFNTANAVGKILTIENNKGVKQNFIVTGVLKNLPPNSITATRTNDKSSSNNSIFLPLPALKTLYGTDDLQDWNTGRISYIQLNTGVTPGDLIKPVQQVLKLYTSPDTQANTEIRFLPLPETYLNANNGTVRKMIYTLSLTALLILLMAVVNFINISIGNSTSRLKEIGLRKVFGGAKRQLVLQFLMESLTIVFIAVCFSLFIYRLLQPVFSSFTGKHIPSLFSFSFYFISGLIVFIIITGLIAGIYPAAVLSSVKITESVKGKFTTINENILLRKILIGFQFFIAIVVFTSAIIISKQVFYNMNADLGFDKEQVLNVKLPRRWSVEGVRQMETIRNSLAALSDVEQASISYTVPGWNVSDVSELYIQGKDSEEAVETYGIASDDTYAETFKIPLLAGKFFSGLDVEYDSSLTVINETLLKSLGWRSANEAIGKILINANDNKHYRISGVIKDFHFESKQAAIKPLAFFNIYQGQVYRFLSVRIKSGNVPHTIEALKKKWSALVPDEPFDFSFMDETLQMVYQSELQLKNASYAATVLAVIIVLLGTIGIIALSIAKRTKEMGIRKVMGASVPNILALFVNDIVILIAFAALPAFPVAYLIMKLWLNNYAYRIDIGIYPFAAVFVIMIFITTVLICLQAVKAAMANPVKSLRAE
ncbi:ABC transporter permease [Parafilimonas sp.]|uniref:ABC transporter permease n=1 Tax=Parafilimonas sp. TaxID=1969739 RepID=UPI0039E5E750